MANGNGMLCPGDAQAEEGKFCLFDPAKLDGTPCSASNDFGYKLGTPCVMIRINRIYKWQPAAYSDDQINSLKNSLPAIVVKEHGQYRGGSQRVYLNCSRHEGANHNTIVDVGSVDYYPQQAVEFRHYPFTSQHGYQTPFVMVHFGQLPHDETVTILCDAWSSNMKIDRAEGKGVVQFQLHVQSQAKQLDNMDEGDQER